MTIDDWVKVVDGGFPPPFEIVDIAYLESDVPCVSVGYLVQVTEDHKHWYEHIRHGCLQENAVTHWRRRPKHPEE